MADPTDPITPPAAPCECGNDQHAHAPTGSDIVERLKYPTEQDILALSDKHTIHAMCGACRSLERIAEHNGGMPPLVLCLVCAYVKPCALWSTTLRAGVCFDCRDARAERDSLRAALREARKVVEAARREHDVGLATRNARIGASSMGHDGTYAECSNWACRAFAAFDALDPEHRGEGK